MEFGQLEDMGINAIGIPISHLWVFGCFISCLCQHVHALGQTSLILLDFHQRGLAMRKWNLFPLALCPLFQSQNITTSQTPLHYPPPQLRTREHFQVNRASFCAQENIIWGLHVSSSKATPRPRSFCPKHRAGSLQKYSELVPNIREASCCCQNFTSL